MKTYRTISIIRMFIYLLLIMMVVSPNQAITQTTYNEILLERPEFVTERLPCVLIDWNQLLDQGSSNHRLLTDQGDTLIINNGRISQSDAGMLAEWSSTQSNARCYHIQNLPQEEYVIHDSAQYYRAGYWQSDWHGTGICLVGPCYPGNSYEGKIPGTNVYVNSINQTVSFYEQPTKLAFLMEKIQ